MNTLNAKETLPFGYREAEKIDLVKNKKQMLLVNGLALALAAVTALIGVLLQPPNGIRSLLFAAEDEWPAVAAKLLAAGFGTLAYIVGHEAVHGVFMWRYSRVKPRFGLSFTYAYAGSDCYFAKDAYLIIALAPVVVWFVLLGVLALAVPAGWFWAIWFIQIMNISGAAGDFYVFVRMLKKPETVLVQDTGTAMTVYLPE